MSGRILYVERTDRGDRLTGLRLVGPRTEDAWSAPADATVEGAIDAVREGAAWARDRLLGGERSRLEAICLDTDGTICSWLTAPTTDPTVLAAIARGMGESLHDEHDDHAAAASPAPRALDHFAGVGAGLAVQARATSEAAADQNGAAAPRKSAKPSAKAALADPASRRRVPVLGVPDSTPGLLIDALDQMRVPLPEVVTFWHSMVRVWDPAAQQRHDAPRADRLVADDTPVAAIVLIEPAGRLSWAWSRRGELLAGGTMRLAKARAPHDALSRDSARDGARQIEQPTVPRLDQAQASRLAADWLAWSAQTGACPGRVIVVAPEHTAGQPASEFAQGLVRAWPGATVDAMSDEDPVLTTLRRAIEAPPSESGGTPSTVEALTARPGRAHRSMYVWSAAAIAGLAVAAGVTAVLAWRTASDARDAAAAKRRATSTAVLDHYGDPGAAAAGVILTLESDLALLQAAGRPAETTEFKPVMEELETISLVVSSLIASHPRSQLVSLRVDNLLGVTLHVRLADVPEFEQLRQALAQAGRSELVWRENSTLSPNNAPNQPPWQTTLQAGWRETRPGGATP
ncbi:MAG: hypothetical protein R3B68_06445 [Phycisphaerales bacterium]